VKPRVVIRERARKDIEAIDEYLAENASAEVAVDFVEALWKLLRLLASKPHMGRAWSTTIRESAACVSGRFSSIGATWCSIARSQKSAVWRSFTSSTGYGTSAG
jgi:plasmid stabilization system protein ParE